MTIPTIGQWAADCDAALSAYPNDPAKRLKVLESYFSADRRALLEDDEKAVEAMVREACDDLGYGLGDRWKGITTSADLDDIAYSMLAALRRHHGVEP